MTVAGRGSVGAGSPPATGPIGQAVGALRDLDMPWVEIDQMLTASDPRVVRRYLELHLERLEERLTEDRATLDGIGVLIAAGLHGASDASAHPPDRLDPRSEPASGLSVGAATARS